ncbi:MAG: response regulator [Bacteroidia bacterium]|nr:response regulator [Bacteroidia bacterium]
MMKKKIVIVEDEAIVAMENKMNLTVAGFDVIACYSKGEDVLLHVNQMNPDLILMDIKLKGNYSGIDTVERMREKNNIPVLFVTGNSDNTTLQQLKVISNTSYLLKPVLTNDLIIAVKKLLLS